VVAGGQYQMEENGLTFPRRIPSNGDHSPKHCSERGSERQHVARRKKPVRNSVFVLTISELGIHLKGTLRRNAENATQILSVA